MAYEKVNIHFPHGQGAMKPICNSNAYYNMSMVSEEVTCKACKEILRQRDVLKRIKEKYTNTDRA